MSLPQQKSEERGLFGLSVRKTGKLTLVYGFSVVGLSVKMISQVIDSSVSSKLIEHFDIHP